MDATPNSFHCFVRDAVGETYLHTFAVNEPATLAAAKLHARWWIAHRRRPGAYLDKTFSGGHVPSPCGRAEIVVEFYDDESARRTNCRGQRK